MNSRVLSDARQLGLTKHEDGPMLSTVPKLFEIPGATARFKVRALRIEGRIRLW